MELRFTPFVSHTGPAASTGRKDRGRTRRWVTCTRGWKKYCKSWGKCKWHCLGCTQGAGDYFLLFLVGEASWIMVFYTQVGIWEFPHNTRRRDTHKHTHSLRQGILKASQAHLTLHCLLCSLRWWMLWWEAQKFVYTTFICIFLHVGSTIDAFQWGIFKLLVKIINSLALMSMLTSIIFVTNCFDISGMKH